MFRVVFILSLIALFNINLKVYAETNSAVSMKNLSSNTANYNQGTPINSTEALKSVPMLIQQKKSVGFDIDSTILYTELMYNKAIDVFKDKYNETEVWEQPELWNYIEEQKLDVKYSFFKKTVVDLMISYLKSGVDVYIITARTQAPVHDENNDSLFNMIFKKLKDDGNLSDVEMKKLHKIIYVGEVSKNAKYKYSKTEAIINNNISVYYGDADTDILAAEEAKIVGIRVMRNSIINYLSKYQPGMFKESILIGSDY